MIRVLVAGLGTMGRSHALAYHHDPAFQIVGLVNRSVPDLPEELRGYAITADYHEALARLKPDLPDLANNLGTALHHANQLEEAARVLTRAHGREPRAR